jgi:hypothetical protein
MPLRARTVQCLWYFEAPDCSHHGKNRGQTTFLKTGDRKTGKTGDRPRFLNRGQTTFYGPFRENVVCPLLNVLELEEFV